MSVYTKTSKLSKYPEPRSAKVVVVGPSGVGKTSISNRFVKDQFSSSVTATMGAAFQERAFQYESGKFLRMKIWDTAGQEKYRAIGKIYYQDANIAVLVYDVTCKQSFEQMQVWAEDVRNIAPKNIALAVVGNKIDLLGDNYDEQMDQMNFDVAKNYAKSIGAIFTVTSAKNNKGVQELFSELANKVSDYIELASTATKSIKITMKDTENPKRSKKKSCCQ